MDILLIDFKGKQKNIALMKYSTYWKTKGANVYLNAMPKGVSPDKVFCSVLFSWDRSEAALLQKFYGEKIEYGGTGWDLKKTLPPEVECCLPDHDLYKWQDIFNRVKRGIGKLESKEQKAKDIINAGIGFTSRGCVRNCPFCIVPEKEGALKQADEIKDIINPRSNLLTLLDNNLTADPNCIYKLNEIRDRKLIVDISQGVDVRIMTPEKAQALSEVRHQRSLHYAWDLMEYEDQVIRGIKLLSKYVKTWKHMCFVLVGFNTSFEEDMYRVKRLVELGVAPYIMVFNNNESGDQRLKHFARWVNGRFHKTIPWAEYEPWVREKQRISLVG